MIGQLFREISERRTSAEKRNDELEERVLSLAADLDAISVGDAPPSGRRLVWAGDVAAALRGLLEGAVH